MLKSIKHIIILLFLLQVSIVAKDINIDELVKQTDKDVYIFLHRTDCGYCDSMIEFTFDDETIHAMIEKDFFVIDININHNDRISYKDFVGNGREFAKHIGYNYYPSSIFIDANNSIIYGAIGYQDEHEFLITLKFIHSKAYLRTDIDKYCQTLSEKDSK